MGPKKQPRNGYYFLMIEHKRMEEERGRFITMKMAAKEVQHTWATMDQADKDYYNKMADKYKLEHHMEKYNTLGTPYSEINRMQHEKELEEKMMVEWIRDTVRHLDRNTTLCTKEFHVIHINYYCETDTQHFIPAEIAIAKFNFEGGIIDTLHTFVSPGELPMGYRYIATEHTNKTHKTPLDWDKGETDLNKLLSMIKMFLKPDGNVRGEYPPMYTMPDDFNTNSSTSAVKGVLHELCVNSGDDPDIFKVFSLPKLFFELRNFVRSVFPAQSIAESELIKDVFNYSRGIACQFHEDEDAMEFCSLSTVKRWVFLVCDHCCKDLEIELIPGKHCPEGADIKGEHKRNRKPVKEKFSYDEEREEKRPSQANNPITIIDEAELRQPYKSSIMGRYAASLQSKNSGNSSADSAPSEKSTQKPNCWSSVAERSHGVAAPPTFDESNYPSIGGGFCRGATGDGSSSRSTGMNWSGRGRGSRGRGLAASFGAMNFGDK